MSSTATAWKGWCEPIEKLQRQLQAAEGDNPHGERRRASDRLRRRVRQHSIVIERLAKLQPDIFSGQPAVRLDDQQVDQLFQQVCEGASGYGLAERQRFLVTGLHRGSKELDWRMPIPLPLSVNPTEISSATPDNFVLLQQAQRLLAAFWHDLRSERSVDAKLDQARDAGQLLFSFLMHSYCFSKHWFDQLPSGITGAVGKHEQVVWLDLGLEHSRMSADSDDLRRRIFPAPVTQLLLQRWYKRYGRSWPQQSNSQTAASAQALILRYAKSLCSKDDAKRLTFSQIAALSSAQTVVELPGIVSHYLRTKHLGTPLLQANWMRLVSGKQVTPEAGEDETGNVDYLTPPPVKCHPILGDQLQAFKELCRVIYRKEQGGSVTKTQAELLSDLKKFVSRTDLSTILQLLTAWAIHLVRDGGMVKSRLAPSSVVRYLHWVGGELIIHSPDLMAPETLDADEWQAIYEVCIAKSKSSSGNVTARLAEFHRFLEAHYGVPPVDLGAHGGKRQVDARLLTPREYLRVRQLIRKSGDTVLTDIQELVLILGYRCGLRRGEVWSRLLVDFPGLDHPRVQRKELLVRPNKISGIKSWAGTRRLPLSLLLQKDELEALTAFYRKRKAELVERAGNQALFSVDGLSGLPADQKLVFDTITACLRKVTGDPAFRFHHLRHSFVSLTFLRLMETYPGEHVPQDWRQGRGGAALLPSMQAPLWRSAGLSDTRRSAWLLGQWAGHASPAEAMLSYSHLLDWLTRSYLWRPARGHDLSRSEQCVLLDKSQAAIEQFRYRQGLNDRTISAQQLCDLVVHQWPKTAIKPLPAGRWSEPRVPEPVTVVGYRPERHYRCAYDLAWRALEKVPGFDGNYRPRGVEGAAQMLDVSLNDAQRWHRNAIHLMSMKSTRQTSGFYYDEQGHVIEQRARLSTGAPGVKRALDEKDFQKGFPELPTFIAPPRGEIGRQSAAKWYEKLLGWHSSAPKEANACMTSVLEHAQRSRARIKTRSVQSHQAFCRLLQRVGLESSIRVRVHLSAGTPTHAAVKHWAKTLAVREKAITVKVFDDDQKRLGSFGKSHVFVDPPKAFHGKLDRFWSPFRFAVMSALVVTGDLVSAETQKEASGP